MLKAVVLICSLVNTPNLRDCDVLNAVTVLRVPGEYGHPATCFMHGIAFLAQSALEIAAGERVKVACQRIHQPPVG
jgi:hypothetical protein